MRVLFAISVLVAFGALTAFPADSGQASGTPAKPSATPTTGNPAAPKQPAGAKQAQACEKENARIQADQTQIQADLVLIARLQSSLQALSDSTNLENPSYIPAAEIRRRTEQGQTRYAKP